VLGDRGAHAAVLEGAKLLEARQGKNAVDERRRLWPVRAVDREAREGGVTKENGDGDVGDRDIAEEMLKRRQMKTSPMRVSAYSSSQRARARWPMSAGSSAGVG